MDSVVHVRGCLESYLCVFFFSETFVMYLLLAFACVLKPHQLLVRLPRNSCYEAGDITSCTGMSVGNADRSGKDWAAFSGNSWVLVVHTLLLSASFNARYSTDFDQSACCHTTHPGNAVSC